MSVLSGEPVRQSLSQQMDIHYVDQKKKKKQILHLWENARKVKKKPPDKVVNIPRTTQIPSINLKCKSIFWMSHPQNIYIKGILLLSCKKPLSCPDATNLNTIMKNN